jgi:hypothetical protein
VDVQKIRRLGCVVQGEGNRLPMALVIASFTTGWRKRPAVLENLIFELIGVLEVESGLEPSKRGLARDFPFNVQG